MTDDQLLSQRIRSKSHGGGISRYEMRQWAGEAARLEERTAARLRVVEPRTYAPDSPHSFFVDVFRAERASDSDARERLTQHERETAVDEPRRREARARAAQRAYEAAFTGTAGERRTLEAFTAAGGVTFEHRAMSRVDGQGGYLVPPAFLIDQAVPAARAEGTLAYAVTQMPLPDRCDSVSVPRRLTGTGTGSQTADLAVSPSRDLTDALVTATVRTVTGIQDVAAQWLDQGAGSGGHLDQLIWDDLHADELVQLDGNLILGAGTNGQSLGLLPAQTTIGTSLAVFAPNGNTSSTQTLSNPGGSFTSLLTTITQCISGVGRARERYPTHILSHPWVWAMAAASVDSQFRPLLEGKCAHPVVPGAVAEPGVLGYFPGTALPFLGDFNVPTTYGNASAQPYLGITTGAQVAAQPGTGATALYTPVIPLVASDIVVFLGEPHIRLMSEVLSGTLQYRFQIHRYYAAMVNRYQAVVAGTLPNSGGWAVNACSSYGIVTQQAATSLLAITTAGF